VNQNYVNENILEAKETLVKLLFKYSEPIHHPVISTVEFQLSDLNKTEG